MTRLQLSASSSSSEPAKANDGYQSNDKDVRQLALSDSEYKLQTWEDLTAIIGSLPMHHRYLSGDNQAYQS